MIPLITSLWKLAVILCVLIEEEIQSKPTTGSGKQSALNVQKGPKKYACFIPSVLKIISFFESVQLPSDVIIRPQDQRGKVPSLYLKYFVSVHLYRCQFGLQLWRCWFRRRSIIESIWR